MIVATHSADFLMGCLQTSPDIRLVRLTYSKNQATARSIEPNEISILFQDPLLRSANTLSALFHRGVVISEADSDRAFYEEINTRLLQAERGAEDTLFMNAQNWQTIPRLVSPLRHLGIPAAAIFDLDVLMQEDFAHIWPLLYIEGVELQRLQNERNQIKQKMDALGKDEIKEKGILALDDAGREQVRNFIQEMCKYGLFFVPCGELECWLPNVGVARTRNKPAWLTNMFIALGSDPTSANYINPSDDDVWAFIGKIETWIDKPDRLGIPD